MNVTQFVQNTRDLLDDRVQTIYTDAEIVRHGDQEGVEMYRTIFRSIREWSNFALHLKIADAKQLMAQTYEWRLPTWVERVVDVYERTSPSNEAAQSTYSSYLWTTPQNIDPTRRIMKTDPRRRDGWTWEGNHTLRIWKRPTAPAITVFCQALPSPMFKGKVSTVFQISSVDSPLGFYRPSALTLGETTHIEEGRYVNAYVQVTDTSDIASTNLGEIRRVIYSRANAIVGGTRQYEFRVEYPWNTTLAAGDTIESLIPVEDIHSRCLILRTVDSLAIRKFNWDLQKSIATKLREAKAEFAAYAEMPRDNAGPGWYQSGRGTTRSYDPNFRSTLPAFGV